MGLFFKKPMSTPSKLLKFLDVDSGQWAGAQVQKLPANRRFQRSNAWRRVNSASSIARAFRPISALAVRLVDSWTIAVAILFASPGSTTTPQSKARTSRAISPSFAVTAMIGRPSRCYPIHFAWNDQSFHCRSQRNPVHIRNRERVFENLVALVGKKAEFASQSLALHAARKFGDLMAAAYKQKGDIRIVSKALCGGKNSFKLVGRVRDSRNIQPRTCSGDPIQPAAGYFPISPARLTHRRTNWVSRL